MQRVPGLTPSKDTAGTSVPKLLKVVAQLETGSWMLPLTTRCHQSGLSQVL